ncbi:GFA family protein [Oceanospirillum sediminis]|uniref:GFA family protein n=1 Tax=Oceanospirillum sediminis TaxID=2760088 RepID=A0A839IJV4_9GAMM|nr:GFA family protein [Oceanospirillum sediminis]MBB1485181.1 GFA family protein [Oceanospirillum sediminis]
MSLYKGKCLCGSIEFEIDGEFDAFYLCHCTYCKKDTGSAHGANLFSASARLNWLSGKDMVNNWCLPGTKHERSFCRQCGSALPVYSEVTGLLAVPAGSLDSPINIKPDAHIFVRSRADWEEKMFDLPQFETFPDMK